MIEKIKKIFSIRAIKIAFLIFTFAGVGYSFLGNDIVLAQDDQIQAQDEVNQKLFNYEETFDGILKVIYALLWPVLVLIGWLVDNSVVYGEFLHLDASLWTMWNIMKNFANFTLGFLVLFAIVKNVFSPFSKSGDKWGPVSVIKKTLIAGVLIQASWFLMAAVIDVSTIMTYSIGGLPTTLLQRNPEIGDRPIIGVAAKFNLNSDIDEFVYYNTYGGINFSPCDYRKLPHNIGNYIVGREYIKYGDSEDENVNFISGYCTFNSWPYKIKENPELLSGIDDQKSYDDKKSSYFSSGQLTKGKIAELKSGCFVIKSYGSGGCYNNFKAITNGDLESLVESEGNNQERYTLDTLLEKSKGFVGTFVTIYSNILDFSNFVDNDPGNNATEDFFQVMVKGFFAIALFFPLLATAVVLLVRVGILWIAIVASPILLLIYVFKDVFGNSLKSFDYLQLDNLIKLIFAPVMVVFAISMSLVFLSALNPKDIKGGTDSEFLKKFNITPLDQNGKEITDKLTETDTYSILGLFEFEMKTDALKTGKDNFAYLITNMFAIGLIRFFLFFAIKATGSVGEKLGGNIQKGIEKFASSIPIIPIGSGVGWNAFNDSILKGGALNQMSERMKTQSDANLNKLLGLSVSEPEGGGLASLDKSKRKEIFNEIHENGYEEAREKYGTDLSAAGITKQSFQDLTNNYIVNNTSEFNDINILKSMESPQDNEQISTFDAEKYSATSIESLVRDNDNWTKWAKSAVGSNITTADGVKVMANIGTHGDPQFKLMDITDYNTEYLPQTATGELNEKALSDKIAAQYAEKMEKANNDEQEINQLKEEQKKLLEQYKKEAEDRIALNNKQTPEANQTGQTSSEESGNS